MTNCEVRLCGVTLKNPVIAASGTFGYGQEMQEFIDVSRLGAISTKAVTLYPRQGNPAPRIAETPSGCINSVGLQNPGVEAFLKEELPRLKRMGTVVIANIAGSDIQEYEQTAKELKGCGAEMIELNISCPNVKQGGMAFGTSGSCAGEVTEAVKKHCKVPLIVKLSPNVTDIVEIAKACVSAGADALSLINTVAAMAVDPYTRRPILKNINGGLSGPCIKPIGLKKVFDVAQSVDVPIIGMGGIIKGTDAIEYMLCGASAVQVGTANLMDPGSCIRIIEEIEDYMASQGISDINSLVGGLIV